MNRIAGIVLLLVGCVLIYFGWQSHESISSNVSEVVTGAPSQHSILLLALGGVAAIAGLVAVLRRA